MYLPFHLTQWWVLFMLCSAEVEDRTLCLLLPLDKHACYLWATSWVFVCVCVCVSAPVLGGPGLTSCALFNHILDFTLHVYMCVQCALCYMHIYICVHAQACNCMWKPEAGARPLISLLFVYWDMVSHCVRGSCFLYCRAGSVEQPSSWMVCA